VIGWGDLPDISPADTKEKLTELMKHAYPDQNKHAIANYVGQVWAFRGRMQEGDLVVLPLKTTSMIAVGKVTGPYVYKAKNPEGTRHSRPVKWMRDDIPREAFGQDLLYSFGAFMTVCKIERNDAEQRIKAVVEGKKDPLAQTLLPLDDETAAALPVDLGQYASDQIRQYISRKFKGHELAMLIDSLLKAEGYMTFRSPPGADGGVDILAGRGPLGFEHPKLCVQVKSTGAAVDVTALRQLQGTMTTFKADQGLLVSWSGFTKNVMQEGKQSYFAVRFWDAADVISAIFSNYDKLSEELRAELPLKRIWTLVPEEEDQITVADK
jgi:restriction system protein